MVVRLIVNVGVVYMHGCTFPAAITVLIAFITAFACVVTLQFVERPLTIHHQDRVCHAVVGPPSQLVPPDHLRQVSYVAVDGPPRTKYGCHGWSALPQVVPCSKPEKQWLQLQIDLSIYTDRWIRSEAVSILRTGR